MAPDMKPGTKGNLSIDLPGDWQNYDALYITATDQYGRLINTWSWKISTPEMVASRLVQAKAEKVKTDENGNVLTVTSGTTDFIFDKGNGSIKGIKNNGQNISFSSNNLFTGLTRNFTGIKNYQSGDNYIVEVQYDSASYATWTIMGGGWLKLDYGYSANGTYPFAGITFSYPEKLVNGATLMADGPYHVWKNRLKGTTFGVFDKKYNNTITGQTWNFPEFKGYYANLYAVEIQTKEQPITIVSATDGLFLHLFTPEKAANLRGVRGEVSPAFPSGDISLLHGITAIGTKFSRADAEGPQGAKNMFKGQMKGTVWFKFGR
jgi:hypothetical protein